MTWWGWLILGLVLATVVLGVTAWQLASRLDRLHRRILTSRSNLGRTLVKRNAEILRTADLLEENPVVAENLRQCATAALAVADSPLVGDHLNPDVSALPGDLGASGNPVAPGDNNATKGAARGAESVEQRLRLESAVSRTVREELTPEVRETLLTDPVAEAQLGALDDACYRVRLARSLHNQDVMQARALRTTLTVRVFHLAGHAPVPEFADLDDQTK